jgi:non-canonical purine NTP pyrophosphatase (RdgB/HAM1 family)
MKNVIFVTGNSDKARLFSEMVGLTIKNKKVELDEIQSLDLKKIVKRKALQAYSILNQPLIVEDTKLSFNALGKLPGPLIKFFIAELGDEGICRLLDGYNDRTAIAGAAIAYYDGINLKIFEKELHGTISDKPSGNMGFGWDSIFIPEGSKIIRGDMDEKTYLDSYRQTKPFKEVADFLTTIDKSKA